MAATTKRRTTAPQGPPDNGPLVVGLSVLAIVVGMSWVIGLPPVALAWAVFVVGSFAVAQVPLTGPPDASTKQPTPASEKELSDHRFARVAQQARTRLLFGVDLLWPGRPVRLAWLVGVSCALVAFVLPVAQGWYRLVNALAAFVLVTALARAHRDVGDGFYPAEATTLPQVVEQVRAAPGKHLSSLVGVFAAMVPVGMVLAVVLRRWTVPSAVRWAFARLGQPVPAWASHRLLMLNPWVLIVVFATVSALLVVAWQAHTTVRAHWKEVAERRRGWNQKWEVLKQVPAPVLVGVSQVGQAMVEVFELQGRDASVLIPMGPKVAPMMGVGAGHMVFLPETTPDPATGAQVLHPNRVRLVTWPQGVPALMGFGSEDHDEVRLVVETVLAPLALRFGAQPALVTDLACVGSAGEGGPVWAFAPDGGADIGILMAMARGDLATGLQVPKVRGSSSSGVVVAGPMDEAEIDWTKVPFRGPVPDPEHWFELLDEEDRWVKAWRGAMKTQVNEPTLEHAVSKSEVVGDGSTQVTVERRAFITRDGQTLEEFFRYEPMLQASLAGGGENCKFAAVSGFQQPRAEPGVRHSQAVQVFFSMQDVPSMQRLAPGPRPRPGGSGRGPGRSRAGRPPGPASRVSPDDRDTTGDTGRHPRPGRDPATRPEPQPSYSMEGSQWVLSAHLMRAFSSSKVKLARPQVYGARCLTSPSSDGHVWLVEARLEDGVTVRDVREKRANLQAALGVEWLRIVDVTGRPRDIVVVAGARPTRKGVVLASARIEQDVARWDWEQHWLDARVVGADGSLPVMIESSRLPQNPDVQVVDFALPGGIHPAKVRETEKVLTGFTKNAYVELRPDAAGPSTVRVLTSEADPMPLRAPYDYSYRPSAPASIPLGVATDGSVVEFDSDTAAHLLVVGSTGSGKTALAQSLVTGALKTGALLFVVDPQKQGPDYAFADAFTSAKAVSPGLQGLQEAQGLLQMLYDEMKRRGSENARLGVGHVKEWPVPPPDVWVFVDEFMGLVTVPDSPSNKPETDPELEQARLALLAEVAARKRVAYLVGRLLAESRSAGFHVVSITQKMLTSGLPSSLKDLKTNSNRLLISPGDQSLRQATLVKYSEAPPVPSQTPPGRAMFESLASAPVMVQLWFDVQPNYQAHLESVLAPVQRWDYSALVPSMASTAEFTVDDVFSADAGDEVVLDLSGAEPPAELVLDLSAAEMPAELVAPTGPSSAPEDVAAPERLPSPSPGPVHEPDDFLSDLVELEEEDEEEGEEDSGLPEGLAVLDSAPFGPDDDGESDTGGWRPWGDWDGTPGAEEAPVPAPEPVVVREVPRDGAGTAGWDFEEEEEAPPAPEPAANPSPDDVWDALPVAKGPGPGSEVATSAPARAGKGRRKFETVRPDPSKLAEFDFDGDPPSKTSARSSSSPKRSPAAGLAPPPLELPGS